MTPTNGPSHHLKYHLQQKTTENVRGQGRLVMGGDRKRTVNKSKVVMQISVAASSND